MKIGIISDTHDNVENILKAVKLFTGKKVNSVLHCGDVVAPSTVNFFNGVRLTLVRGNCDGDVEHIKKKLEAIGGEYLGEVGEIALSGKKILMYHGTDSEKLDNFIKSGKYHFVLTGHTHTIRDESVGGTRVLNPGAHYYNCENTVMLLDVENDKVEVVQL